MKRITRKQKKAKEAEIALKESNEQNKHVEDNNVQNEDNNVQTEDNRHLVEGNNQNKDNLCALEDNTMQNEHNVEDMMETDRPIQDVSENLVRKRIARGPTKMKRLPSNFANRVEVEFNESGIPIGEGSIHLSSYLGPLVREHVPVTLADWRHLGDDLKTVLWDCIQTRFKVDEEWQKVSIFQQMGCIFRCSKCRLVNQLVKAKSKEKRLQLKPDNIGSMTEWNDFISLKTSSKFKIKSDIYKAFRRKQVPHTCSRKGMARLAADMKKESSNPSSISRTHVWIRSDSRKNGEPVSLAVQDKIEQIKKIETLSQSSSNTNVREDAISVVLGQDRPGRLRGMGRSMTYTKFIVAQASKKQETQLQNRVSDLEKTVLMLQNKLMQQSRKDEQPRRVEDENASQANKYDNTNAHCDLLDWTGVDEIVAEGRVLSTDPKELVYNIPLGPKAMKILIVIPKKLDAFLWRSTPKMLSHIGEAKNEIVAWPSDRVVLHTMSHFEKDDIMSNSGSTNIKCKLYDWTRNKELVAEGRFYSSDPNQLVNNIPLGPSAVLVSIDEAKKPDAFLWRPPAGMTYVGEAIDIKIAWPETNVVVENVNATTSAHTANVVLSSTSANSKTDMKCKLINVQGAKEVIAEGRVASTDPKALVHFVPLGENAVKVWVDVIKVPNAPLWRPTSYFEFIEDALGSTIAWPSTNIIT